MELKKIISLNPSKNYEIIGEVPISSHSEISEAVARAKKTQPVWASLDLKKRIAILDDLYKKFVKKQHELAKIIAQEMGMPITIALQVDIGFGLNYMRGYLDNAQEWLKPEITFENQQELHYLVFEPKGVAGVSVPWNYPFCNFIWGIMQNLIVGNTVVFKHSEECPLTGKFLDETMIDLPKDIVIQVYGDGSDVGEYLMNADIDLIYFTGSTGVGKHLYQVAAKKFIPAILELGGSAPGIVFEDADLKKTIESVYLYRFINSGQTCDALKRLIVHRSLFNNIIDGLKQIIANQKIGEAQDPATTLGPLAAERQLISLENQVTDALKKGAKIITGGKRPQGLLGAYYEPTILVDISRDMLVWKEEVFGPVLPVIPFDTEEEAIMLANDTQYGLSGYIYTQDKERAVRASSQMQTGNVSINGTNYVIAQDPFGGYKNSGLGREHGKQGLREFCNSKVIALTKNF